MSRFSHYDNSNRNKKFTDHAVRVAILKGRKTNLTIIRMKRNEYIGLDKGVSWSEREREREGEKGGENFSALNT